MKRNSLKMKFPTIQRQPKQKNKVINVLMFRKIFTNQSLKRTHE